MSRNSRAKATRIRRPLHCRNGKKYHQSINHGTIFNRAIGKTHVSPGRFGRSRGRFRGKTRPITTRPRRGISPRRLQQRIDRQVYQYNRDRARRMSA